jgi:pentatricopeptide repeat protein
MKVLRRFLSGYTNVLKSQANVTRYIPPELDESEVSIVINALNNSSSNAGVMSIFQSFASLKPDDPMRLLVAPSLSNQCRKAIIGSLGTDSVNNSIFRKLCLFLLDEDNKDLSSTIIECLVSRGDVEGLVGLLNINEKFNVLNVPALATLAKATESLGDPVLSAMVSKFVQESMPLKEDIINEEDNEALKDNALFQTHLKYKAKMSPEKAVQAYEENLLSIEKDYDIHEIVLHYYLQNGNSFKAFKIFDEMINSDVTIPEITWSNVIFFAANTVRNTEKVVNYFKKMEERGVIFHPRTISIVLKSYNLRREYLETLSVYEKYGKNLMMTVEGFNMIIMAHLALKRVDDAFKMLTILKLKEISPNVETFILLLEGAVQNKFFSNRSHELSLYLKERKDLRHPFIGGLLIKFFGLSHQFNLVEEVFLDLKEKGIINNFICHALLHAFAFNTNLSKTFQVLNQCVEKKYMKVTLGAYTSIMTALIEANRKEEIIELYEKLLSGSELGYGKEESRNTAAPKTNLKPLYPDETIFNSLIEYFSNMNDIDKALEIFVKASEKRSLGADAYLSIIRYYSKASNMQSVLHWLDKMAKDRGRSVSDAFAIALSCAYETGSYDTVFAIYRLMTARNYNLSSLSYEVMILTYMKKDMLTDAFLFFEKASSRKVIPPLSSKVLESLIVELAERNDYERCFAIHSYMRKLSLPISFVVYESLMKCLLHREMYDSVKKIYFFFVNSGIPLSNNIYEYFIKAVLSTGQMTSVISAYERMKLNGTLPSAETMALLINHYNENNIPLDATMCQYLAMCAMNQ